MNAITPIEKIKTKPFQFSAFRRVTPSGTDEASLREARMAFLQRAPFFASLFLSSLPCVYTDSIPTLATDGARVGVNPGYLRTLRPGQRVFALAHEVAHVIWRHPQRFAFFQMSGAGPDGKQPFNWQLANIAADYVINARLVADNCGDIHPSWLLDPDVRGSEMWEEVYTRLNATAPDKPKQPEDKPGEGRPCDEGSPGPGKGDPNDPREGQGQGRGAPVPLPPGFKPKTAGKQGGNAPADKFAPDGAFDEVMAPVVKDSGSDDVPSDAELKEMVARAAQAAKEMGKFPASMKNFVDELLAPKVDWREQIELFIQSQADGQAETWNRLNRRRLVLNPQVGLPGRRGYRSDTVVVLVDTSGSIYCDKPALQAFFSEVAGILETVKPKHLWVVMCDAEVKRAEQVEDLSDIEESMRNIEGGGGTDFIPFFDWIEENLDKAPDYVIGLTDMMATFPETAPGYNVLWVSTLKVDPPFGQLMVLPKDELV